MCSSSSQRLTCMHTLCFPETYVPTLNLQISQVSEPQFFPKIKHIHTARARFNDTNYSKLVTSKTSCGCRSRSSLSLQKFRIACCYRISSESRSGRDSMRDA